MGAPGPEVEQQAPAPPAESGGVFSPAMLGALIGVVVLAVLLSVFIVMRVIGPQVEQRRVLKEERELMGQTIDDIIRAKKQFPLEAVVVNLAGSNAERYLRTTVVLGYEFSGDQTDQLGMELETRRPEIRNQIISVLQSKELRDVDSKEGRESIRREILNRVNAMLVSGRVLNVYYTEFVVQ